MANKYHNQGANPSSQSGDGGGSNKAQGSPANVSMPVRTANWPGLPGKSGPDRSAGVPNRGYVGQFYALQEFSPRKMGKPMKGEMESGHMMPAMHKKMGKKPTM